jgi:hypothetical protein
VTDFSGRVEIVAGAALVILAMCDAIGTLIVTQGQTLSGMLFSAISSRIFAMAAAVTPCSRP